MRNTPAIMQQPVYGGGRRAALVLSATTLVLLACSLAAVRYRGRGSVVLARGDPCAVVYNSWRDWNPESPECLHGYLKQQETPDSNCVEDPMLCAGDALERLSRPQQEGKPLSQAAYNAPTGGGAPARYSVYLLY
jgi:hypothetical protein